MSTNPIKLHSHARFVSKLYSLTGPRESLPTLLSEMLNQEVSIIHDKLDGSLTFTSEELQTIRENFQSSALVYKTA